MPNVTAFAVRQGRVLGLFGFNLHNKLFRLLECLWWTEPKRRSVGKLPLVLLMPCPLDATWITQLLWLLITQTAARDHSHISFSCSIIWLSLCYFVTKRSTSLCIYVWSQGPKEQSHKMINDELTLSKVLYFFRTASLNPKWNFIWFVPPYSYFSILSLMNKLKHLCLCFRPLWNVLR